MPAIAVVAENVPAARFSSRAKRQRTTLYAANATPRRMARLAALPNSCFGKACASAAITPPSRPESAVSRRAAPRRGPAPAPAAFEPDQEANAERDGKAGNQLVQVHGWPGNQSGTVLGVTGPNV